MNVLGIIGDFDYHLCFAISKVASQVGIADVIIADAALFIQTADAGSIKSIGDYPVEYFVKEVENNLSCPKCNKRNGVNQASLFFTRTDLFTRLWINSGDNQKLYVLDNREIFNNILFSTSADYLSKLVQEHSNFVAGDIKEIAKNHLLSLLFIREMNEFFTKKYRIDIDYYECSI